MSTIESQPLPTDERVTLQCSYGAACFIVAHALTAVSTAGVLVIRDATQYNLDMLTRMRGEAALALGTYMRAADDLRWLPLAEDAAAIRVKMRAGVFGTKELLDIAEDYRRKGHDYLPEKAQ